MDRRSPGDDTETVTVSHVGLDPAQPPVALPQVAADTYQLLGEVARGGSGRILRARDRRLGREVALKQLHDHDQANRARFVREALLTARLEHPAIIPVHEVGQFPSGEPFIAMKLVRGESMREAIRARPTLAERLELLPNVLAVADAMAYAHSLGVIHRDLKPGNVLVGAFAETVVIDWGLAKQLDGDEVNEPPSLRPARPGDATVTGQVLGTPAYMPPEQALGQAADKRSDVYALGALLYQVIAGEAPFVGKDAADVLRQVLTTRPRPLAERVPETPSELAAIVERAMAARPEARQVDARALAQELRSFQLGRSTGLRRADADAAERDPTLAAEFDAEQRLRTLKSVRVTCVLALVLITLFAFLDLVPFHGFLSRELLTRLGVLSLIGGILATSYRPFGVRWSHALGVTLLTLIGVFLIGIGWMRQDAHDALFTPSMLVVFLGCSALFRLPRAKTVAVLVFLTLSQLVVALGWEKPEPFELVCEMAFLVAGTVIVVIGANISERLQRAEFYGRRRLLRANERLAQLGQRSG